MMTEDRFKITLIDKEGCKTTQNDDGEQTRWWSTSEFKNDDSEENDIPMIIHRGRTAVYAAYQEYWDKVWYARHEADVAAGIPIPPSGMSGASHLESQYGKLNLECTSEFDYGLLCGRLSALAWVGGAEWNESLDT